MIVLGLFLVAVFIGVVRLRRRRAGQLAGLDSARPVFTVAPPSRNLQSREDYRL